MEKPSLPSSLQPPPCAEHPPFPASYCCFDQACGALFLSCVLCIKNKHVTCRPNMVVQVVDLPLKVVIEPWDTDPAGTRLEDKYAKAIQELLKTVTERSAGVLLEGRDRIETKSVQNLGATTSRFSFDNWNKFRQDWRVEFKPETQKIVLTKTNRVSAERLSEHCQALDEHLRRSFGQLLDRLAPPKVYLLKEIHLDAWASDGNISISAVEGTGGRAIQFELEAAEGEEDGGKAWSTRSVSKAVHEVTVSWTPEAPTPSFQVGLATERHLERFRAKEQFKIIETLSYGSEGKGASLTDLSHNAFKIPVLSPFRFYIDLGSKEGAAIFDPTGGLNLSRRGPLSENFLFVSLKSPGVKVTIKELA